jgi:hypothetical protein
VVQRGLLSTRARREMGLRKGATRGKPVDSRYLVEIG